MSLAKRAAVRLAARDGRVQFSTHVIGIRGDGDLYVILLPVERGVGIDALLLVQEAVGGLDAVFCNHVPYYIYILSLQFPSQRYEKYSNVVTLLNSYGRK